MGHAEPYAGEPCACSDPECGERGTSAMMATDDPPVGHEQEDGCASCGGSGRDGPQAEDECLDCMGTGLG